MSKEKFYSLIPYDFEMGHGLAYQGQLANACELLGMQFVGLTLRETLNNSLIESSANLHAAASFSPSLTHKGLASGSEFPNVTNLGRISNNRVIQYLSKEKSTKKPWVPTLARSVAGRFFDYVRLFYKSKERATFFLETIPLRELMAIAMASLFLKRGDRLILLFRFPEKRDIETVLKRLLRWRGVTIVSDSERISQNVLPIPHTTAIKAKPVSSKNPTFWWPGPPRLEKGIATILQLAQNAPIAGNLKAPGINYLPELTREQYVEQLAKSDILLLPYDANAYASRTSGPFVEAISAGKIAVVREGTWMAAELEKHNLSELIVDFTSIEQIAKLADNQKVLDKLEKMQQHYLNYHNIDNFSSVLKSLMRW